MLSSREVVQATPTQLFPTPWYAARGRIGKTGNLYRLSSSSLNSNDSVTSSKFMKNTESASFTREIIYVSLLEILRVGPGQESDRTLYFEEQAWSTIHMQTGTLCLAILWGASVVHNSHAGRNRLPRASGSIVHNEPHTKLTQRPGHILCSNRSERALRVESLSCPPRTNLDRRRETTTR